VAAQPDQRLADLPLLPAAERQLLLDTWNATARPFPVCGIHQLVEAQVARTPQASAVAAPDGDLTYAELNARANQLAAELRARGAGPDSLIGLCASRSRDLIVGIIGILKAGAAYLPLDPTYPPDRLALMLDDAQVTLLVTQRALSNIPHPNPLPGGEGMPNQAHPLYMDELPLPPPDHRPAPAVPGFTPQHLAYVIYTSGSSGKPKGVMIPHVAVTNMLAATLEYVRVTPDDVVLQFATFCFDVSVLEIFAALCAGARLLIPPRDTLLSPRALTELLQRERVSFCDIPPAVLELLPADAFPALRTQFIGCESFSGELVTRWIQPGRRLINGYGPTEATVMMTLMECTGSYAQMPPIGYPMANQQVYVLDAQRQPTPIGVPGELYIGGMGLARGYLNRPALTAEKFIPNPFAALSSPFSPAGGGAAGGVLYRTGDLVRYRADGALEFLGRVDQQVKIRGYRIELGEIEAALAAHPAIHACVVLVRAERPGAARLVAYVVPSETLNAGYPLGGRTMNRPEWSSSAFSLQPSALVGELRSWLGQRLPSYMVPAFFVQLERFPLMPNGKVDRAALPEPNDVAADRATFAAPRTALEQMLAGGVFAQVLGVDNVGIHDNFFELGGNSLQAAQVQSSLMDNLHIDVPLTTIFQSPTIAQLSEHIDALALATQGLQPVGSGDAVREEGEL
jgi:amino acid adenylation domain-containing protein